MLLVPADPLRPRRPDEHFAPEARAAREAGLTVAVVDHDALARGDDPDRAVASVPAGGPAVYRGWMLRGERYAELTEALARRGVSVRTTAEQYRRAHELPGWYPALAAVTPRSAWTTGAERADFDRARRALGAGPAIVRDHVKSMKHHWHEATFIPDLGDRDAAWAVARRLRQLRADDFVGGFVLRAFEPLGSAEVRTWWVRGRCALVGPHPDTPHDHPAGEVDLGWLAPLVAGLRLPFVTVDLALRADGVWRVVEVGDGQVSDRPVTVEPTALLAALTAESR
ncbi:ATP-grasp domain-containing protein [Micromonospora sp. C28SCA-DRY-2]|uniref:ATP-grasp domain-containing protein n=1 Tax=Micromonospora sp. C28SCA-DRY-2 TaxID=3059522 RepID=UPI002675067A|nr:ATP-grasp domain-containing protein [Micromonospora sp. C28SCA-DRY-2]MDO3700160.1 ATP-grasp domain-containing protein [Micromonospora sp. C28SCA-DRY-2]